MKQSIIFLFLILGFGITAPSLAEDVFTKDKIIILSEGRYLEFEVEIASTSQARKKGLMFRQSLAPRSGMLFDYGEVKNVSMWMKNTYIPLDIIFIDENGIILNIVENTVPLSLSIIPSNGPVLGVLEVLAGTVEAIKIKQGDRVLHSIFSR